MADTTENVEGTAEGRQGQQGQQGQQAYLTKKQIQQKLEENAMLLEAINERQNVNSLKECAQLQAKLEVNLRELARLLEKSG